ncbi:DUF7853 family protein [Salinigranum salinum]|uniref:DUF7853 family protein n=1 Tax=Salinigranum salinum TaxID=1364937 RepID=UPI0012610376|nr:hypothetical protein [Salinigranum salinum]
MVERHPPAPVESLVLSREQRWTLHHVLLDWLGRETAATSDHGSAATSEIERAFAELDAGGCEFTHAELQAVQDVLASYHHSPTWWEVERSRLEGLLHEVSARLAGSDDRRIGGGDD